ncbi:MAG: hypothetical protein ACJ8G1_18455 [Vitreoscilla sp.]
MTRLRFGRALGAVAVGTAVSASAADIAGLALEVSTPSDFGRIDSANPQTTASGARRLNC